MSSALSHGGTSVEKGGSPIAAAADEMPHMIQMIFGL
jgi:hypothetical protein